MHFNPVLTIRRGRKSEAGGLEVEYGGCTPAYAGVEVNDVKKMMHDGITKEEADKIKKENPIDASSHDLLASCLTIFTGVFGKSQADKETLMFWQDGSKGLEASRHGSCNHVSTMPTFACVVFSYLLCMLSFLVLSLPCLLFVLSYC